MTAGKKILIVEDDPDLATLISVHLYDAGYEAHVALDGVLAMTAVRDFKPDLLVVDYVFPAGGGAGFIHRLRHLPHTAAKPILIVSGVPEATVTKDVTLDGRTAFMAKPYNWDLFLNKIKAMLMPPAPAA